jgi:aldose 1-epimerase
MAASIVEIFHPASGSAANVLVSQGFNCFSWRPTLADGPREMLWAEDGFETGDKRPSSGGIPLLFPFPGRIGGAKFDFGGRTYQLETGDAFGNAIHGFVLNRPWRVIESDISRVVGEFQAAIDDRSVLAHWPSDFRIRVSYEVRATELVSNIEYANTGDGPLPSGFATHAYFRLPLSEAGEVADTVMTVPVASFWELEKMVPTGRVLPAPLATEMQKGLVLGEHQFDTVFTNLQSDATGQIHTRLAEPSTGRTLMQSFDSAFTQCVVYTPGHRHAICMEPYTCVPDAIRLQSTGIETGLQVLKPGEEFRTTITIKVSS